MAERFRGSSEIPLTDEGVRGVRDLATRLAAKGGLHEIQTSDLGRTVHTSRIISQYTHAPITYQGTGLHPWHLGSLEGQEITPETLRYHQHLIKDAPDEIPQGRGPLSTADGESFNQFKARTLPMIQKLISQSATSPTRRIGVTTHYRVKKLLDAWLQGGSDPDGAIDTEEMIRHGASNTPGSVDRLVMDPYAGPQMFDVDLKSPTPLGGGLYFLRHEATAWNAPEGS